MARVASCNYPIFELYICSQSKFSHASASVPWPQRSSAANKTSTFAVQGGMPKGQFSYSFPG